MLKSPDEAREMSRVELFEKIRNVMGPSPNAVHDDL